MDRGKKKRQRVDGFEKNKKIVEAARRVIEKLSDIIIENTNLGVCQLCHLATDQSADELECHGCGAGLACETHFEEFHRDIDEEPYHCDHCSHLFCSSCIQFEPQQYICKNAGPEAPRFINQIN